jgi:uroporphyrinogen-III decarboxylase
VVWWERDFPAVRGRVHESVEDLVRELDQPETSDGELRRVLEHTEYFLRHTSGRVPIRLTDIQGPLDSAALVLGHSNFLLALRAEPRAAHALLQKVTDLTIAFARRQRELVRAGAGEFVPAMFQPWIPDGWGISVSNDECVMISREMHDEFAVPYLNQLSDAFGGIYIHSCGDWTHQFSSLENVRSLRGLEFGASEVPFERVLEHWGGRAVLAARVGLHRDRKFNGMVDFVTSLLRASKTNRGLFLNVDITNGIVDRSWPATDVQEIYRMVGL